MASTPSAPSGTQSGSGDNIDITQIGNDQPEQLAAAIETFYKQDGTVKQQLSKQWERTQMMLDGQQWLVFSEQSGTWNHLTVSRDNEYIPRPVTNIMWHCYQTLKGYFTKTKPTMTVAPNDPHSFEDKAAATLSELCVEVTADRLKETANMEYADSVALGYGHVLKKDYWDPTAGEMIELPPEPIDPNMPVDPNAPLPGLDPVMMPIGDVATAIVEPFRIAIDPLATSLHTAGWIMEYAIQSLDWIKQNYGKTDPGYTGLADTVKEEASLSGSMQRFYQLKNSSGVKNDLITGRNGSDKGSTELTNSAVVKEYYEKPSALNPNGRMVVIANGVCLYAGESPCSGPDEGDWHPYSDFRWELVPGRYWAKGPLDAICELQKRLNSIDATIILTRKTMAIPQKLVPKGSGIAPGSWTGRPGQQIDYNQEAGVPSTVPAAGVDASVFKEREQVIEEMKMISGAMDILTGDRPPGVNAASAFALLIEMGTGKLYPMLDRKKEFIESSKRKQLIAISKNYKEHRPEFVQKMKQLNKKLPTSTIEAFLGTDLRDNVNVVIEVGSNVPKLEAMKQMRLQEAAQAAAIDLATPVNRREYQRQMGIVGFDNDVGPDMTRAEWENDCLDNILVNPDRKPVVLNCDEDEIHIQEHTRRMKEPAWMELEPQIQQAYMMHVEEHNTSMQQKQMMQAMQDMAMGQQPQPQGGANDPTKTKSQGKGAPNDVREQAMSADVPPGATVGA